jgi:hypothetical protein
MSELVRSIFTEAPKPCIDCPALETAAALIGDSSNPEAIIEIAHQLYSECEAGVRRQNGKFERKVGIISFDTILTLNRYCQSSSPIAAFVPTVHTEKKSRW